MFMYQKNIYVLKKYVYVFKKMFCYHCFLNNTKRIKRINNKIHEMKKNLIKIKFNI